MANDNFIDLIQGTPEWHQARAGSLGASQIHEALARTKTGWGASRANLEALLVIERITGMPVETYTSPAMQWGKDTESEALANYEFISGNEVKSVGLVRHPRIPFTHASPDGLVGGLGLIEAKCPNSATHIQTLLSGEIDGKYRKQMQWQMACTGRQWCDFVSYDPRLPATMRFWMQRFERDDNIIKVMEHEVETFLDGVAEIVGTLKERYG